MTDLRFLCDILYDRPVPASSYLHDLPAVRHLETEGRLTFHAPITFFVGENGTGKSTLLEAIAVACGFNAEGGSRNFRFATRESHSELWQSLRISRRERAGDGFFLRAESFYNVATNIEEMDNEPSFDPPLMDAYGGVSFHEQSHGESFLALVQKRFRGNGLYLLDEPEAALSPMRLMTLMAELHRLAEAGSQFLIATHSPILITMPEAEIFLFGEEGIRRVDYTETPHYQITKQFLSAPDRMLRILFGEA